MLAKNFVKLTSNQKNLLRANVLPAALDKRNASAFKFLPDKAPAELGETTKMNLYQSVTNSLDISLSSDKSAGTSTFSYHTFIC